MVAVPLAVGVVTLLVILLLILLLCGGFGYWGRY